jgi:hypothetical protein
MDDPELVGIGQRTLEELERGFDEDKPNSGDDADPVVAEFYSGEAGRALSAARDDLAAVSRQQVHRQFSARSAD